MHFHIHVIPKYGKAEGFKIGVGTLYVDDVDKVYKILAKPTKLLKRV
jgi:diadenosine tetraphosphate (Ap4A) HIT family hydrolase